MDERPTPSNVYPLRQSHGQPVIDQPVARDARAIDRLIQLLARLPGLGPRSARRATLHLIKHKGDLLLPLCQSLDAVSQTVVVCERCGNIDDATPCHICQDKRRENGVLLVVEDVADVWALERSQSISARYHVLGGVITPLDGIGPDDLRIKDLPARISTEGYGEIILALNATVEGQTTSLYIAELLRETGVRITRLAHGVPVGGELDYLDDGTIIAALNARRDM